MARSAKDLIDQAIAENRTPERLYYVFASVLMAVGVGSIVYGAVNGEGLVALAGGIATALFVPAMGGVRAIRRENLAIRLLEASLERAESAEEAARVIRDAFKDIFTRTDP